MRHSVFGRKLGRDTHSRYALLRNLASSVMLSGYVVTTEAKAKFVKATVEKLIRNSQRNSLAVKRDIASMLNEGAFSRLINEIGPGFVQRPGGYTRIVKMSRRRGDCAPMAKLELLPWDVSKARIVAKKPKVSKVRAVKPKKVVKTKGTNEKPKS